MVELICDERASALFRPVETALRSGLALLPDAPALHAKVAPLTTAYELHGDEVLLSDALVGPEPTARTEPPSPLPPLDRWRRGLASVFEAASLRELSRRTRLPPVDDWRWVGAAVYAADAVAPELGLAAPELALAVSTGDPGAHPRAGYAVMRAWAAAGVDPIRHVRYLLEGGVVSAVEWLKLGRWIAAPERQGELPVPVARAPDRDIPLALPAWSWSPLRIPAHPRGGRIRVEGDGAVDEPWAPGGQEHRALAAAAGTPCTFTPEPGGPVGVWDVASAEGFGQVMGARGIRFTFAADGRLELVLADAFVGPLAAVAMAEQVGTSGLCAGKWRVSGAHALRFDGVDTASLTLHSRTKDRFMVPARGFGIGEWLLALGEDAWSWQVAPSDRLVLRGRMMGGDVQVRLKRASGSPGS